MANVLLTGGNSGLAYVEVSVGYSLFAKYRFLFLDAAGNTVSCRRSRWDSKSTTVVSGAGVFASRSRTRRWRSRSRAAFVATRKSQARVLVSSPPSSDMRRWRARNVS